MKAVTLLTVLILATIMLSKLSFDTKINDLQERMDELVDLSETTANNIVSLEEKISDLETEISELKDEISDLQSEVSNLELGLM